MSASQWHRFYTSKVAASPGLLFDLLSDMPNYDRWLPPSGQFARTTDVQPYPVQLGSRYHDGKPGEQGKDWWGSVVGFQRPGSLDFHHTIRVDQLRATVDVHIHYSFEQEEAGTLVTRWLVLDFKMPIAFRPLRAVVTAQFDKENLRTMAAVKKYAEAHAGEGVPGRASVMGRIPRIVACGEFLPGRQLYPVYPVYPAMRSNSLPSMSAKVVQLDPAPWTSRSR